MTEKKIEDAVTKAEEEAAAAEAAADAAKAQSAEHISQASGNIAEASKTAAALAEVNAAKTINDNQEDILWLKSNAQETASSLKRLEESQTGLVSQIPQLLEAQQAKMMDTLTGHLKTLSTQPISQNNGEPLKVSPEEESAAEAARQAAEKKMEKPKRGPKHRENWI